MRISEYLQISDKLKNARTAAGISQRDMAKMLNLTNSTYSNYENGYSEPPMEVIIDYCQKINISIDELFGMKVESKKNTSLRTFSEFLSILIDLDRRGLSIHGTTTYQQAKNQLIAHLNLDIENAQLATFIPDWTKVNEKLASGKMDETEYAMWLDDTLRMFNVPIDEFLYKK